MEVDLDVWIDLADAVPGGVQFFATDVFGAVENLALEVGEIDGISVDEAESTDPCCGEVEADGRSKSTGSDAEDASCFEAFLSFKSYFGHDEMPGVTCDFVVRELDAVESVSFDDAGCHRNRSSGVRWEEGGCVLGKMMTG
jgi:hypothetical protein